MYKPRPLHIYIVEFSRTILSAAILGMALWLVSGCSGMLTIVPDETCSNEQHAWGNYRLHPRDYSPVIYDNSKHYNPDLQSWNDLGTPIQLRAEGAGMYFPFVEGGDEQSPFFGRATITHNRGIIKSCVITMNWSLLRSQPPELADMVSCMEIGHCLGLDHDDAKDSCMNSCLNTANHEERLKCLQPTPGAHDAELMELMYEGGSTDRACAGRDETYTHMFLVNPEEAP